MRADRGEEETGEHGGLSRREREIVDILYAHGRATAAEVREAMAQPPTDAAVRATLRILVEKGQLERGYDGPRFLYWPAVPREKARRSALRHLLQTFFGGSAEGAMVALLEMEGEKLGAEERERLKRLIDQAEQEGR